jgi:chromate reductase, NAD(P)H dehydrogenase (quinone)
MNQQQNEGPDQLHLLVTAGSLRTGSLNKLFARGIAKVALRLPNVASAEYMDPRDLHLPLYDGDIETAAFPEGAERLAESLRRTRLLLISTPEYNGAISPVTKNMIDWVSRLKPNPWPSTRVLLFGASPGALGAVRGLLQCQSAFQLAGAHVWPQMFGLSKAHERLAAAQTGPDGLLPDDAEKVLQLIRSFLVGWPGGWPVN